MRPSSDRARELAGYAIGVFSAMALLAGAAQAFFGIVSLSDPDPTVTTTSSIWGAIAIADGIGLLGGASAALRYLATGGPGARVVALTGAALSAGGSIGLVIIGLLIVDEAATRGGDWAALAVAASWIFCVIVPATAFMLAACLAALLAFRRAAADQRP